jgi:hypothetical protein
MQRKKHKIIANKMIRQYKNQYYFKDFFEHINIFEKIHSFKEIHLGIPDRDENAFVCWRTAPSSVDGAFFERFCPFRTRFRLVCFDEKLIYLFS